MKRNCALFFCLALVLNSCRNESNYFDFKGSSINNISYEGIDSKLRPIKPSDADILLRSLVGSEQIRERGKKKIRYRFVLEYKSSGDEIRVDIIDKHIFISDGNCYFNADVDLISISEGIIRKYR